MTAFSSARPARSWLKRNRLEAAFLSLGSTLVGAAVVVTVLGH